MNIINEVREALKKGKRKWIPSMNYLPMNKEFQEIRYGLFEAAPSCNGNEKCLIPKYREVHYLYRESM